MNQIIRPIRKARKPVTFSSKIIFVFATVLLMSGINITAGAWHTKLYGTPVTLESLTGFGSILAASAIAAIWEEAIFRLFLITVVTHLLSKKLSGPKFWVAPLLISSLAFMLIHPPQAYPLALLFGLVLGYTYIKYGLVEAMIIHFCVNVITFSFLLIL